MPIFDLAAHEAVGGWKQEAKDEDNGRYFFPVPEAELMRSGAKSFLIARKGKGKTAVGQSILQRSGPGDLATALSFKNYPFNRLYDALRDAGYKAPNQYIAGWRYLILCEVARMLADDPRISSTARRQLKRAFNDDIREALSSKISRLLSGNFRVSLAGVFGVQVGAQRQYDDPVLPLNDSANQLQQFLEPELARINSRIYIVFDELDEDYTSSASADERREYFALLTGLLKAVREVRHNASRNVLPVVLLRDDIFRLLSDPDRTKWNDDRTDLRWSEDRLKQLLSFRLCRAANCADMGFEEVWSEYVGHGVPLSFNTGNRPWTKFDYIASYTLQRPRDFIYYLSFASRKISEKLARGTQAGLSVAVLKECLLPFAQHLQSELEDEISGQLPYIKDVMKIILSFDDQHFKRKDFRTAFEAASAAAPERWPHSPEEVLKTLYDFSVIGFVRGQRQYYHYKDPDTELDPGATMLLHKGLTAAQRAIP